MQLKRSWIVRPLLVLAVAGLVYFGGGLFLGSKIRESLISEGSALAQAQISLDSAFISPFTGRGHLRNVVLANPEGIESSKALQCKKVYVNLDWLSLFGEGPVVVKRVYFQDPVFAFEKRIRSSNFKEILDELEAPMDTQSPKTFILGTLIVGKGNAATTIVDRPVLIPTKRVAESEYTEAFTASEALAEGINLVMRSIGAAQAEASIQIRQDGISSVRSLNGGLEEIFQIYTGSPDS